MPKIFKRKDGRYCVAVSVRGPDGKPHRQYLYGQRYADVDEQLARILGERQKGITASANKQTVGEWLEHWLETVVKRKAPRTYAIYAQQARQHIIPFLGHIRLSKLTPMDIDAYVQNQLERTYTRGRTERQYRVSPRTVQMQHAILRAALNQAMRYGLVGRNVAEIAGGPTVRRSERSPFTADEARAFLAAVEGHPLAAFYWTMMLLGLRPGEALGLGWEDVNWGEETVTIRNELQRIDGVLQLKALKTESSRDTLPIPELLMPQLLDHRHVQKQWRVRAGPDWGYYRRHQEDPETPERWVEPSLIFTTSNGTPLDEHNVSTHFKSVLSTNGLPSIRLYDLRHTAATLLIEQGVDLRIVMAILRHSQIALTANTYTHVRMTLKREAVAKLDEVLRRSK